MNSSGTAPSNSTYGAGGYAAYTTGSYNIAGGTGGPGIVIVEEFY